MELDQMAKAAGVVGRAPDVAEPPFHLFLIKPTHYDSAGYPIQWRNSWIASNTLACINALAVDCRDRKILGPSVEILVTAMDEISEHIPESELIWQVRRSGGRALVCLVGVQSNQFPRSMDIARPFRAAGLPVVVGGIHVSGCLALLRDLPPDLLEARQMGISLFAGEAESGRFERLIQDAYAGALQPIYNFLGDPPEISGEPVPILTKEMLSRGGSGSMSIFDAGRGCPFDCTFCTIINVHGHKSRFRSADDLEKIVLANDEMGIHQFFVTDDNLARNRNWESLFERLIDLRERRGIPLRLQVQIDTQAYRIPGFIDNAVRAGVDQIFIGLESVNPDNLAGAGKHQNRVDEFREMMLSWKRHPVVIICGYMIGFPNDTPESIRRDVEVLKRELPIDLVYFTVMQPLPGSRDHQRLVTNGIWMDPDMNKYDTTQPVTEHPRMTMQEWRDAYLWAWKNFYTFEHMAKVLRRMVALGSNKRLTTANRLFWFSYFYPRIGLHPIDGGFRPLRRRHDRRPTLPRENPLIFYPKNLYRIAYLMATQRIHLFRIRRLMKRVVHDPASRSYRDEAIAAAFTAEPEGYSGPPKKRNYVNFPNIFGISERLNDKYWECFKAHDNMYGIYRQKLYPEVTTRREADDRMYQCLIGKRCPKYQALIIYYAVRLFGARFWKKEGVTASGSRP